MTGRHLDDFEVGEEFKTHARTLTEADVVNFAGVTGDFNPLHMDETYARTTRFGRRVPHGQLIFVLSLGLAERCIVSLFQAGVIAFYGVDRLRFVKPVFIGDTFRLARRVDAVEPRDAAAGVLTFEDRLLNQDDDLCLRYFPKYLLKRRPGDRAAV